MDDDLADRIRRQIGDDPNIGEVRMFGGLCFTLNGNMLVCSSRDGDLLARIGEGAMPEALRQPGISAMKMAGKDSKAFIRVNEDVLDNTALQTWIARATSFVGAMPAKPQK